MLPEKEIQVCDSKYCTIHEVNPQGLGLGRAYTDLITQSQPNPISTPVSWCPKGDGNPYTSLEDPRLLVLNLRNAGAGGGSTTNWLIQN